MVHCAKGGADGHKRDRCYNENEVDDITDVSEEDAKYYFDLSNENDYTNTYFQKLVANIENAACDAMIGSEDNILGIARGGRVLDLRDERVKNVFLRCKDRLLWYETEENEKVPVAVSLAGSRKAEDLGYAKAPYFAFASNAGNMEMAEKLLWYLLGETEN